MKTSARIQFIEAGLRLYPKYGYRKLSVRLLAAESGLSSGMFHHLFAGKDAFIAELWQQHYETTFGTIDFISDGHAPPSEQLRHAIRLLAHALRDNLDWVNRLFADSSDGIAAADIFLRRHATQYADRLYDLLGQCFPNMTFSDLVGRMSYILSSVITPMFLAVRFDNMGILPEKVRTSTPDLLTDEAIEQRITWTFSTLPA
ncbi:TetR/AcrR family transcriptional regulator [Neisseria montereyensis]|uniref:TetR/AcrR family transcriptional regulator n=1 Tax=Neisseria montereyensis TaxID=2973938 RepID=A0ABT2FDB3_9NEIS|nr:TetR/AcrR family transcriptional regulator [Neisseria montereyensis]MCS4533508.1 TetR/AcrR family transcriptional regulator [Neisseria montereyensis]